MFLRKLMFLCALLINTSLSAMENGNHERSLINKNVADKFDLLLKQEAQKTKVLFDNRLHRECANGNLNNIKTLLKNDFDINQNTPSLGGTPLILSVYHNYYNIAEFLLLNEADPNIIEASYPQEKTALDYAWELERNDLFVLLLIHGGIPKKYAKIFDLFDFAFEILAALTNTYCNHFPSCNKKKLLF